MRNDKYQRALKVYNGHKGESSLAAVWSKIPQEIKDRLTGKDLGAIMNLINDAYHAGKTSAGAEMIDSNAVYINSLGKIIEWNKNDNELIPKFADRA